MTRFVTLLLLALAAGTIATPLKKKSTCNRVTRKPSSGGETTTTATTTSTTTSTSTSTATSTTSTSTTSISTTSTSATSTSTTSTSTTLTSTTSKASASSVLVSDTTTATASAPTATSSDAATFLTLHNDFRAHYGASAVTWNDTLAAYAKKDAESCVYGHTGGPYGENIAAGTGDGYDITFGFESWSNESTSYDWNNPGYSDKTGHFTQIVWKETTQIGCAAAPCTSGMPFNANGQTALYIVCEYYVQGNILGNDNEYFKKNVGTYQG